MDAVARGAIVYLVVWLIFRVSGKRTLSEVTTFDFVLLLIIGEATQQALLGQDFSIVNAALVIVTIVGLDILASIWKQHFPRVGKYMDNLPVVIVENGRMMKDRMDRERISETEILEAARQIHGIERMDQIKHVVLEVSGGLSIIPRSQTGQAGK